MTQNLEHKNHLTSDIPSWGCKTDKFKKTESTKHGILRSVARMPSSQDLDNLRFNQGKKNMQEERQNQFKPHRDSILVGQLLTAEQLSPVAQLLVESPNFPQDLDLLLEKLERKVFPPQALRENPGRAMPGLFMDIGPEGVPPMDFTKIEEDAVALIYQATSSRESSVGLQCYISECCPEKATIIAATLSAYFKKLLTHKYGNYVLQRLAGRDQTSKEKLAILCQRNLDKLIADEYASRVMQLLIESVPKFRQVVTTFCKNYFSEIVEMPSACHLLIACIKSSSRIEDFDFIARGISFQPTLLQIKSACRILGVYLPLCSSQSLDLIVSALRIKKHLLNHLNNRSINTVILLLLQRNNKALLGEIGKLMKFYPIKLLDTGFFKHILAKIFEENPHNLRLHFGGLLISLSDRQLRILRERPDLLDLCHYFALAFAKHQFENLEDAKLRLSTSRWIFCY